MIDHLMGRDDITVYFETGVPEERYPEIEAELVAKLKSKVGVTVTPKAVPLSYLPRSEKKTSRFFDNRY